MTRTREQRESTSERERDRADRRDWIPAVVALVILQASVVAIGPDGARGAWDRAWLLLPIFPVLWIVWAVARTLRRADEYQRLVQLEAMAIGLGTTLVLAFTGGLLDAARLGDPRQSLQVTFIGGTLAWIVALIIKSRRAG